jgi:hypothetical protein
MNKKTILFFRQVINNREKRTEYIKKLIPVSSKVIPCNGKLSSRQGEFHPEPLTEPYMTVSRHTTLVIQIYTL